jgi:hypothetical protein
MDIQDIQSKLWLAADKLRGNISSSDYKYVVLGLIFLKYISEAPLSFCDPKSRSKKANRRSLLARKINHTPVRLDVLQ